jgi:hypothetical protein
LVLTHLPRALTAYQNHHYSAFGAGAVIDFVQT